MARDANASHDSRIKPWPNLCPLGRHCSCSWLGLSPLAPGRRTAGGFPCFGLLLACFGRTLPAGKRLLPPLLGHTIGPAMERSRAAPSFNFADRGAMTRRRCWQSSGSGRGRVWRPHKCCCKYFRRRFGAWRRLPGRGDLSTAMHRSIANLGLPTSCFCANRQFPCTVVIGVSIIGEANNGAH